MKLKTQKATGLLILFVLIQKTSSVLRLMQVTQLSYQHWHEKQDIICYQLWWGKNVVASYMKRNICSQTFVFFPTHHSFPPCLARSAIKKSPVIMILNTSHVNIPEPLMPSEILEEVNVSLSESHFKYRCFTLMQ